MTPGVVASALGRIGRTPLIGYLAGWPPWHSPKALALPVILTPCHVRFYSPVYTLFFTPCCGLLSHSSVIYFVPLPAREAKGELDASLLCLSVLLH